MTSTTHRETSAGFNNLDDDDDDGNHSIRSLNQAYGEKKINSTIPERNTIVKSESQNQNESNKDKPSLISLIMP